MVILPPGLLVGVVIVIRGGVSTIYSAAVLKVTTMIVGAALVTRFIASFVDVLSA